MMLHSPSAARRANGPAVSQNVAGVIFGFWLAVVPVKFGNPVVFEHVIEAPSNILEFLIASWPVAWSYWALGVVAVAAALAWRWKAGRPRWPLALPLAWFGWTLLSATQTVD